MQERYDEVSTLEVILGAAIWAVLLFIVFELAKLL
jgi:hypothetical protein